MITDDGSAVPSKERVNWKALDARVREHLRLGHYSYWPIARARPYPTNLHSDHGAVPHLHRNPQPHHRAQMACPFSPSARHGPHEGRVDRFGRGQCIAEVAEAAPAERHVVHENVVIKAAHAQIGRP